MTNNKLKTNTVQKMKFSNKNFLTKCDQIRCFQRFWLFISKKALMENFIFCAVKQKIKLL